MATITLEYDGRNALVKKLIESAKLAGAKVVDTRRRKEIPADTTARAIGELRQGKVTRCKDFDEYLKAVGR